MLDINATYKNIEITGNLLMGEGLLEMILKLFELFPDMKITIDEMVFEHDILCFRHTIRGIGANDEIMGIAMVKFRNGKAVDRWVAAEAIG